MDSRYSEITEIIKKYPLLGESYRIDDYINIDLSVNNSDLQGIDVVDRLERYINNKVKKATAKVAIGGYAEERNFYWSSEHFRSEENRTIHLGLDLWVQAGHSVYAPLEGSIHSFKYNSAELDYGYTIVLKHSIGNFTFHTLYGHLSSEGMDKLTMGNRIAQGEAFCFIGDPTTNGGWAPHLHFQVIIDMAQWNGDYPGVSTKSDANHYLQNCPDPNTLFTKQL